MNPRPPSLTRRTVVYTYHTHIVLYLLQLSFLLFNTFTVHLIPHACMSKEKVLPSHNGRLKERMNLCAWEVSLQNTLFLRRLYVHLCINKVHMHIGSELWGLQTPMRKFRDLLKRHGRLLDCLLALLACMESEPALADLRLWC